MLTQPIRDSFVPVPPSPARADRAAVADALRMGVDRWHVTGLVFDLGDRCTLPPYSTPSPARSVSEQWCSQVLVAVDAGSREEAREKGIAAIRARYGARINVAELAVALAPEVTIDAVRGMAR